MGLPLGKQQQSLSTIIIVPRLSTSCSIMTTSTWKKLEECGDVPMFTVANMMTYFVTRKALDGRQANDFKTINSYAFPLFKSGHIQSIKICSDVAQHHFTCL